MVTEPMSMIIDSGMPTSAAAFLATFSSGNVVAMALAPESFNWIASSRCVYVGLAVVTTPPAHKHPKTTGA